MVSEKNPLVVFRKVGDVYQVANGFFRAADGFRYTTEILEAAPEEVPCVDLVWGYGSHVALKKQQDGEEERCRVRVRKAIDRALMNVCFEDRTRHIGKHLRTYLKTGKNCQYLGQWHWSF